MSFKFGLFMEGFLPNICIISIFVAALLPKIFTYWRKSPNDISELLTPWAKLAFSFYPLWIS